MAQLSSVHLPYIGDGQFIPSASVIVPKDGVNYERQIAVIGDPNNPDELLNISGGKVPVTATDLDIRNLSSTQDSVTANLGLLNGAATEANQNTNNSFLSSIDSKIPDESGSWGYLAGVSGTVVVANNRRVLTITATAGSLVGASMTINGGQTIVIPVGTSITISPKANLVAPTVVFTATTAYFIESVL
jgi:hypothetical protein